MTAMPPAHGRPNPVVRTVGRTVNSAVARLPWSWRFFRRPVSRFFDSLAVGWDERAGPASAEHLAPLLAALDHLQADPARILDIGTGTGTAAFKLAARYPDAEVVGVDVSAKMITQAKAKVTDTSGRVRFLVADITNFEDEQRFDLIVMLNMPPFFDMVVALLKPGGFVIHASSYGSRTPFFTPARFLRRGFERRGLCTVTAGQAGLGTYYVARRA